VRRWSTTVFSSIDVLLALSATTAVSRKRAGCALPSQGRNCICDENTVIDYLHAVADLLDVAIARHVQATNPVWSAAYWQPPPRELLRRGKKLGSIARELRCVLPTTFEHILLGTATCSIDIPCSLETHIMRRPLQAKRSAFASICHHLQFLKQFRSCADTFFCVVDLHAITLPHDPKTLREASHSTAASYIAAGVDTEKSNIFLQSHVPGHSELTWLLGCYTPLGWLERMIQFKVCMQATRCLHCCPGCPQLVLLPTEQRSQCERALCSWFADPAHSMAQGASSACVACVWLVCVLQPHVAHASSVGDHKRRGMKLLQEKSRKAGESVGSGLLTYPTLMAADILLYQADLVPVGEDQKQHLELARNVAERFNSTFGGKKWKKLDRRGRGGSLFRLPEVFMPPSGARVMSLQVQLLACSSNFTLIICTAALPSAAPQQTSCVTLILSAAAFFNCSQHSKHLHEPFCASGGDFTSFVGLCVSTSWSFCGIGEWGM
jgi:tryptophanyl-tRNA synthetase